MSAVILSGGRIVGSGGLILARPPAAIQVPNAPRDGITANGGDQSYGKTGTPGFVSYTASGPGTAAYTSMQALGSYNLITPIGASFEGSNVPKQNLVTALKGRGSFPILRNLSHPPLVGLYSVIESSAASGSGYQNLANLIVSQNWWTYVGSGGTGTTLANFNASFTEVNYCHAWPTSAGAAGIDAPICGNVYGSLWNGMACSETAAVYFCDSLLTTNPQWFLSQTNGAAPNADFLMWDNSFTYPNGGGTLGNANGSWDGIGSQSNNVAATYPTGASSLISRGQYHVLTKMQSYLAARNPGSTYLSYGNFGDYFNVVGFGSPNVYTSGACANTYQGGLVENCFGVGTASFQGFQTFAQVLQGYNATMDFCIAPKVVAIGIRLPASDGSQTATWRISGTNTTVTQGTSQEFQCMRAGLCFTLLDDGYATFIVSGNRWNLVTYYDEQGDDSLTQVNVGKNYLGPRVGSRPTAAAFANGMWAAPFANGLALLNPWGNGSQSLSLSQIQAVYPGNWKCLAGTQVPSINTGSTYTSRTFSDPDGQILLAA